MDSGDISLIDLDDLERRLPELRESYRSARPFPHIVLDDFCATGVVEAAASEFPPVDDGTWTNYVHVNERKYGNVHADTWGPTLQALARTMTSARFVAWLEGLTGFEGLLADWSMDGGGLHQTFRGGHLNLHADFTAHHRQPTWRRRVNLLLYLNPRWEPDWGGCLELWDRDLSRCEAKIAPIGNRVVIFTTSEHSFHGHPDPLQCPPGVARRSMALYYFQEEADPLVQCTDYRPRPGDGLKSSVAIYLDKQVLRAYDVVKRRLRLPDDFASRTLARVFRPTRGVRRTRDQIPGDS